MHVLVTSTFSRFKKGGVPTFVDGRYTYLKSKKNKVRVLGIGETKDDFISLGKSLSLKSYFLAWIQLCLFIIRYKPETIEIHNGPIGLPLWFWKKPIYFFHGPAVEEARVENRSRLNILITILVERLILKRSKEFFTASEFFKNKLQSKVRNKDVSVVKPIVVVTNRSPVKVDCSDSLNLVCVRRLVRRTGVAEFCEDLKYLSSSGMLEKKVHLKIIGDGPERRKLKSYSDENLRIELLGSLSDKERNNYYRWADMNVVPTLYLEGFGLVVLEAAFFGCPSLTTDIDALPEVIRGVPYSHVYRSREDLATLINNLDKTTLDQKVKVQEVVYSNYSIADLFNITNE
jgi:glycosyltransferase involved in cell wall biosynthesis